MIEIAFSASNLFRQQNILVQAHFNDTEIKSKLDFSKPINFLLHGWLDGILDRNMHLGAQNKIEPNDHNGMYIYEWIFIASILDRTVKKCFSRRICKIKVGCE